MPKQQLTTDKETSGLIGEDETRVLVSGCDIDGIARGKQISRIKFLKSIDDGFGMCNVVFGWDMHDATYSIKPPLQSQDSGFGDMIAKIDTHSKRRVPWDNNLSYFLIDFYDPLTNEPLPCCPRNLLKKVISGYSGISINEFVAQGSSIPLGKLVPLCGMEYEWFHFSETPNTLAEKRGSKLTALTPGMFGYSLQRPQIHRDYFNDLFDTCHAFNVPIEGLHTETGPGVYEVALEYTEALELADRSHLFKVATKQIALKYGITPCFMAKPYPDQPGCSGHMHFSIASIEEGGHRVNLFAVQNGLKESNVIAGVSQILEHFLAGVLEGLPSIMAILAPNINSYKRLVENYWAPITVSYGFENRTAAIRLIAPPHCPPAATRIEVRVPGADVNPYLAEAAILACGLYGLNNKMDLAFPPTKGDVLFGEEKPKASDKLSSPEGKIKMTVKNGQRLPTSLRDAVNAMNAAGSLARLVLGDGFVDHYVATRLHECRVWDRSVTDWELKRYMETV